MIYLNSPTLADTSFAMHLQKIRWGIALRDPLANKLTITLSVDLRSSWSTWNTSLIYPKFLPMGLNQFMRLGGNFRDAMIELRPLWSPRKPSGMILENWTLSSLSLSSFPSRPLKRPKRSNYQELVKYRGLSWTYHPTSPSWKTFPSLFPTSLW